MKILCSKEYSALNEIAKNVELSGSKCKINKKHHCVDVFDDNGNIIEQWYPKASGKIPSTRNRYEYVGPGNGDFIKLIRDVQETSYTSEDPYIKYIRSTNEDVYPR